MGVQGGVRGRGFHDYNSTQNSNRLIAFNASEELHSANVTGKNDDGIFEVHHAPLAISQPSIIHHLEQHIPNLRATQNQSSRAFINSNSNTFLKLHTNLAQNGSQNWEN